jgi:hypothetical protein
MRCKENRKRSRRKTAKVIHSLLTMRPTILYIGAIFLAATAGADDIRLADGKTVFHNATITSSDAASVTIKHSAGVARVMIPDLPPELRAQFKYEPRVAKQVIADERDEASISRDRAEAEEAHRQLVGRWRAAAFRLQGKILQVNNEGLLLTGTGFGDPIFVKNVDARHSVDGDWVSVLAIAVDPHQYTDTQGARRTIRAFDAAQP